MATRMEQVDIEYIPWALAEGHTQIRIAEHLDRSRWTIQRYARGIQTRPAGRPRKFTDAQMAQIERLVPSIGYAATARAIGEKMSTVIVAARRIGVLSPKAWGNR